MPAAINQAHTADPNPIDDLVFISNDHPRLKFVRHLQPRVIARAHLMIGGISLLACGAVFHLLWIGNYRQHLRGDSRLGCPAERSEALPE
jgi:hypothetical protein